MSISQKDLEPGSGSEIYDFYLEDSDPKLMILDPEHRLEPMRGTLCEFERGYFIHLKVLGSASALRD